MPRLVRVFEPTWQDRYFRKAVEKLSPREREERAGQAASLVKALQTCSHPVLDPRLQTWRPSSYRGVIQVKDAYLVEYRFPGVMRVIACCFDGHRMKRLIRQSSAAIVQEGRAVLEQDPDDPSEPP